MDGFFLIDKEKGMTSFDVVRDIRKKTGEKRVGHSGTLDKLATGLLVVGVGNGTKLLEYLIGFDKEYEVVGRFGYVSDTYDSDGEVKKTDFNDILGKEDIEYGMKKFTGEILQIPPKYSALKIAGKRASDRVRKGQSVEMKGRIINIYDFSLIEYDWPEVKFSVRCSTGTYVRSLIHDLGKELGCGAYVKDLKRNKVGDFSLIDSCKINELSNKIDQKLISLEEVAKMFSTLELTDEDFQGLRDGRELLGKKVEQSAPVLALHKERVVGILEQTDRGIKYSKCFIK